MKFSDLQKHYKTLIDEISNAKHAAKLVAVTKNHLWANCQWLHDAGCRTFGENRVQEALPKMTEAPKDIEWHFIGTLQKNKVNKVIDKFALIHSVDTFDLAEKISSLSINQPQKILIQVNIDHQHGFKPEALLEKFENLNSLPNLQIEGLMTMAPNTDDKKVIATCFREARLLRDKLGLKELSMGMSNDWKIALDEGATLLRIGTLLFED